jgi:hypothetical protein
MVDDPSALKSLSSLRHLFPTLWYIAFDAPKLVEAVRSQTFTGLTRPWAFLGATSIAATWAFTKAQSIDSALRTEDHFSSFGWQLKFDIWITLLVPFILLAHRYASQASKQEHKIASVVALWLYLFGAVVFGAFFFRDVLCVIAGAPYETFSVVFKFPLTMIAYYLILFRPFWLILLFYRAETEDQISEVGTAVARAGATSFGIFIALAFVFHWLDWKPHKLLLPFVGLFGA